MNPSWSDGGIQLLGKTLPEENFAQVRYIYTQGRFFPLEARLHLSEWIEEKFTPLVTSGGVDMIDDPNHQQMATNLATQLLQQLDAKIHSTPNDPDKFLGKSTLQKISENLKQTYGNDLVSLYSVVLKKLEEEMSIVAQVPVDALGASVAGTDNEVANKIRQQLALLKQKIGETGGELDRCKSEQEQFSVEYYACREHSSRYTNLQQQHGDQNTQVKALKAQKEAMEASIRNKYSSMQHHQSQLIHTFANIYTTVKDVQVEVLDKQLIRWKRDQQLAGNGYQMNPGFLDTLQEWCEGLADIIWQLRQQVRQLENLRTKLITDPQNNDINLQELLASVTELLSNLVTGTFVIEKQPPQVMKTNTRFTATVRLLIGGVLNVHMAEPAVSVSIVSESQANQLLTSAAGIQKKREDYSSGDILNSQGTMEYHGASKQVSVSFRNLQLKKIKRTEKKGTESVMDEKFSVLFWTEFTVSELKFQLWTFSLPVVVIVHGNQEPQALATVVWDNGFAEWGRRPFYVPDKVTWAEAGKALNMKWAAACGSPLTEDNLYYLACKAFRNNNIPKIPEEYNNLMLTWSLFCKETLPDRTFTFWEWFYRLLLLTSHNMGRLWKEGFIMGFVTKQAVEKMLEQQQNGCFILRFSDLELGGVVIAYVRKPEFQQPSVLQLYPFTARDLTQRSMADVVFDINDLTVLYPNIPKEVFRKHCSTNAQEQQPTATGYVKHILVTQLQGSGASDVPEMKQEYGSPQPTGMVTNEGYEPLPFHTPQRPTDTPNSIAGSSYDQSIQSPPYNENNSEMEMGDIDLSFIDVRDILNLDANFQPMNQQIDPNQPQQGYIPQQL